MREWVAAERERILAQDLVAADQGDARRVDAPLPALGGRVPRLLGPARGLRLRRRHADRRRSPAPQPGRIDPDEAADAFLAQSDPHGVARGRARRDRRALDEETLAGAARRERLTRREVKEIQSGYKDADRFEKWLSVLQRGVAYEDPIVLPAGEGLNIVSAAATASIVYRCDCGQDFCAHDRNWKMDASCYVRESEEAMLEVYPKMAGPDPLLQQIREYYCPSCARQLEVEALPPGLPGRARLPARHRGLLPRLARTRAAVLGPESTGLAAKRGRREASPVRRRRVRAS